MSASQKPTGTSSGQAATINTPATFPFSGDQYQGLADSPSNKIVALTHRRIRQISICPPAPPSPRNEIPTDNTPTTPKSPGSRIQIEYTCVTPTSPRHRIPPATTCPPAPRKPKADSEEKRKGDERGVLRIDVSFAELAALFRPIQAEFGPSGPKRSRRCNK